VSEAAGIRISHPDRVIFPESGLTKLDVARYLESVGRWIVPHVAGRPLTLVRCPEGIGADCFFMKHSKVWAPPALRRVRIQEKTKIGEYLIANDVAAVVSLAQMGIVEIHTWNSTFASVERPNRIVFDLDPGDALTWAQVIRAARTVRDALSALDLESYVKTTGGRGLHVVVPLRPQATWNACLAFSRALSEALERSQPELYTTQFAKRGRESKILIDYLRNNRTNTSICAFSVRARKGAPVSMPIAWTDLKSSLKPERFTVTSTPAYRARRRGDPWRDYSRVKQQLKLPE